MIIGRVLHQQISQLKWHVLACVALIMVLPLEEALVNLRAGDGFFSSSLTGFSLLLAPLLAGLIACANVQADMDEKRYQFWRSKPVGVSAIIALKFLAGLVLGLIVISIPMLFSAITISKFGQGRASILDRDYMTAIVMMSCLAYGVCFLTNVLVRRTARAWLIGMALTCFALLIPFILPLSVKDIVSDFAFDKLFAAYVSVTLAMALLAFILAILAVKHDWHLRTSLRGLLWAGAALIFALMFLFGRQVANIRILDEQGIENPMPDSHFNRGLIRQGDKTIVQDQYGLANRLEVGVSEGKISLNRLRTKPSGNTRAQREANRPRFAVEEGLIARLYDRTGIYHQIGPELYFLVAESHYLERESTDKYGHPKMEYDRKRAYLRCFRMAEGIRIPQSSLDFSEFIADDRYPDVGIRLIKDNLLALVTDRHCMTVAISNNGDLQQIEKGKLSLYSRFAGERRRRFSIPMAPLAGLDIADRIRLSIDARYGNQLKSSRVHMEGDQISFVLVTHWDIARYDVIKWDPESIHCQFRDARAFTFLEQRADIWEHSPYFVQNGKLFVHDWRTLMVFDIGSARGIRKLGHFERISAHFAINDIQVQDSGRILMLADKSEGYREDRESRWGLYLLEDPQ